MSGATPDRPTPDPGISLKLPIDTWYHLARTLSLALPTPPSDDPEHLLQRNHAAIATVAALVPANSAEANLAADFVAAEEQAAIASASPSCPRPRPRRRCNAAPRRAR